MSRLVLTSEDLRSLRTRLLAHETEACAVLYGRAVRTDGKLARIVVHETLWPEDADYTERSAVAAQLRPEFVAKAAQRARKTGESLVFVHTHPFPMNEFSPVDDRGEEQLKAFLSNRIPGSIHAAMLITPEATLARLLGTNEPLAVAGIGSSIGWGVSSLPNSEDPLFNRQVAVFGTAGQDRLSKLRVGIVGLGGTGSIVAQQLAHLGIGSFLLMDPDQVEITNLNRLVNATRTDVGRAKVEVAATAIAKIAPAAQVAAHCASVLVNEHLEKLVDVDFIFACTDSHGSRAVLNQLSYQYLVPVIDIGVIVVPGDTMQIAGRTQMLAPGLGCLICGNLLDPEQVRVDLLTEFERQTDPYVQGARLPAPAVISLNGTLSSMAITMFLSAAAGMPGQARLVNYNGVVGSSRVAKASLAPDCYVCSRAGALARATEWPHAGRPSP